MRFIGRYSFAFGAADTTVSQTIAGILGMPSTAMAVVVIPDWTNAVTLTYAHLMSTTAPVYSSSGNTDPQAITAPLVLLYERPIHNGCVIKMTLSGAPGGSGGTVTCDLYTTE